MRNRIERQAIRWVGADVADLRGNRRSWHAHGWTVAQVLCCTAIGWLLYGQLAEANLVMVYLLGVLVVSLRGDLYAAVGSAVFSVLAFDFFFVPPYLSFAVSDTQYVLTFLVMGLMGLVISSLTAHLVAEILASKQGERRSRALYTLSRSLLAAQAPAAMVAEGARLIGEELGQSVAAWLDGPDGAPVPVAEPPFPLSTSDQAILRWAAREGEAAGPGTRTFPGSRLLFVPIRSRDRIHGMLALHAEELTASPLLEVVAALETGANQLAIALDQVRAREEAEAALRQVEAERLRNALLSSVSHDLRTPLTGIIGAAGSLVEGSEALTPEVRRELAQGIEEEAQRLSRLVTNLLHATRLEAGAVRVRQTWFPLEDVLGPALARLDEVLATHPLEVAMADDLPLLPGDPVLLEQALANLLENAAKHTPSGTRIVIRAWVEGKRVAIEVLDDGPGLPAGEEERIFEKFLRYPASTGPAGAGLGLAICRGVIEAHGGQITARNRSDGGASFLAWLPLAAPPATGTAGTASPWKAGNMPVPGAM